MWVQIVIPVLSTLLGGFEVLFPRNTEQIPRDLIPVRVDLVSFFDQSLQKFVLLLVPGCCFLVGN